MITNFEQQVLTQLGEIKALVAGQTEKTNGIEKRVTAMETSNPLEHRVFALESSNTRQWWFTACVAPALALGHAIARWAGVKI